MLRAVPDAPVAEGSDAYTANGPAGLDRFNEGPHCVIALGVDIEQGLRPQTKEFIKAWNLFGAPNHNLVELVRCHITDIAGAVGNSIELVVMKGEQHIVGTCVHICLKVTKTEAPSVVKGREGIFGPVSGAATMGEGLRSGEL